MCKTSYTNPKPKFDLTNKPSLDDSDTASKIPTYRLSGHNGKYDMPIIAYGTFRSDPGTVKQAILDAIEVGYRHFDLAHVYGNEKEIGIAFQEVFNKGLVKKK